MSTPEAIMMLGAGALIGAAATMLIEHFTRPARREAQMRRYAERVLKKARLAHWDERNRVDRGDTEARR